MRATPALRAAAAATFLFAGAAGLTACSDEDGDGAETDEEIDDVQEQVDDSVDELDEQIDEGQDQLEQEIDEGQEQLEDG